MALDARATVETQPSQCQHDLTYTTKSHMVQIFLVFSIVRCRGGSAYRRFIFVTAPPPLQSGP